MLVGNTRTGQKVYSTLTPKCNLRGIETGDLVIARPYGDGTPPIVQQYRYGHLFATVDYRFDAHTGTIRPVGR